MPTPDQSQDQERDPVAWTAFCVMAVCMSLSFVFVKISLEGFTVAQSAGGRLVIGASFLVPLAIFFGDGLPLKLWFWKWAALLGLVNLVLPFSLMTYGQQSLSSNVTGAMFSLIPLITIGLSALLLGARISRRKIIGLFVGFLGLIAISEPADWITTTGIEAALPMLSVLGAVLCFSSAAILMRVVPRVHPLSMMGGSALTASVFGILPFQTVFHGDLPPLRPWIGLLGVSILSTTIAYSLRFFLIRRKGPVFLAPNAYVGIVLANVFGVLILGDEITTAMMIAFPLIVFGLFIALDGSGGMKQV